MSSAEATGVAKKAAGTDAFSVSRALVVVAAAAAIEFPAFESLADLFQSN